MGKITVKHYLNTRVSPMDCFDDGKLYYPIYVQITYNRKTTQIKSFTQIYVTESGYQNYQANIFNANDFFSFPFDKLTDINTVLRNELASIELGIKYIIDVNFDLSKDKRSLSNILTTLLSNIGGLLQGNYQNWIMAEYSQEQPDLSLYFTFNPQNTLSKNIEIIKKHTKIDLSKFIRKRDFELSQDIDIFTKMVNDCQFINLVNMDYNSIIDKSGELKNKDYFMAFLDSVIDSIQSNCKYL